MLGMRRPEIDAKFDEIVRFAELEEFIDAPVKTYSSGMYMRLGFAVAVAIEPDILLVDEILAVGDESFQHKCLRRIHEMQDRGRTILFVSHDLGRVEKLCHQVAWLDHGALIRTGESREVIDAYLEAVDKADVEAIRTANRENSHRRWGTREVEITRIRTLGRGGDEQVLFGTGESFVLEISYRAATRTENPVFGVGIFKDDGVCCYGSNTGIDGLSIPAIEGEGIVRFVVERLDPRGGRLPARFGRSYAGRPRLRLSLALPPIRHPVAHQGHGCFPPGAHLGSALVRGRQASSPLQIEIPNPKLTFRLVTQR